MLIRFRKPPEPVPDRETALGVLAAVRDHCTYWALRYTDGRVFHQWDPGVDWPLLPYRGRQEVRLYCPDGSVAGLGGTTDQTGRLFQFHLAVATVGAGRGDLAHVIGMLTGTDGECHCLAWEWDVWGTGRQVEWDDNVYAFRYHNIGGLNADVLGIDDGEGR